MINLAELYARLDGRIKPERGELNAFEDSNGVVHVCRPDGSPVMMMSREGYSSHVSYVRRKSEADRCAGMSRGLEAIVAEYREETAVYAECKRSSQQCEVRR